MNFGYASIVTVFSGVRDFKIQFRDVAPVSDETGTATGQAVSFDQMIAMSPTTAKELSIILSRQIDAFEKEHGEIKTFLMPEEPAESADE